MRAALLALLVSVSGCNCGPRAPDVTRSLVATTTADEGWAVNYPKQRKLLWMAERLWVFYADGVDLVVRTTTDGVEFSAPEVVFERGVFGHRCSFTFDGSFVHSACCLANLGEDVFYRRGRPSSDGTIAWDSQQLAFDVAATENVLYPKVLVDAAGFPWVGFVLFTGGQTQAPPNRAMISRSSRSDGAWETTSGFPAALSDDGTETFPDPLGVALANGDTFWAWVPDGDAKLTGQRWNASGAAGAREVLSSGLLRHGHFNLLAAGDDVHLVYGAGVLTYRMRRADGTLTREVTAGAGSGHSSLTALDEDRVSVTWLDTFAQRVMERELRPDADPPAAMELLDAKEETLSGRLAINLNTLERASPFRSAVAVTVGREKPFEVVLLTRARE